jgi:hypothetical protein
VALRPALTATKPFEIVTLNGADATVFGDEVGALVPGMKGDAVIVYLDRVVRDPWIDPEFDIAESRTTKLDDRKRRSSISRLWATSRQTGGARSTCAKEGLNKEPGTGGPSL